MLAELDKRARKIGFKRASEYDLENAVAWIYGPRSYVAMRVRMLDWAEAHQLRFADRSHTCESWAAYRKCPGVGRCSGQTTAVLHWADHSSSWTGPAGLRLVIGQPYAVTSDDAPALRALAESEGLHLAIHPPGTSWYGFGTFSVLIAGFPAEAEVAAA